MISLDELWKILEEHGVEYCYAAEKEIEEKSVESMPVRRGHWIKKKRARGVNQYDDLYCSECNAQAPDNWLEFCARCGAIMFEDVEDHGN